MWIQLLTCCLLGQDALHVLSFSPMRQDNAYRLEAKAEPFLAIQDIKKDELQLPDSLMELGWDAPIRQSAFLMRTILRNKGVLLKKNQAMPILRFPFTLELTDPRGKPVTGGLSEHPFEYSVTLSATREGILIRYQDQETFLRESELNGDDGYLRFLEALCWPHASRLWTFQEAAGPLLLNLYYLWPELLVSQKEKALFDLFPSLLTWNRGKIKQVSIHLGCTLINPALPGESQANLANLKFGQAIQQLNDIMTNPQLDDQQLKTLESLVAEWGGQRKALDLLAQAYQRQGKNDEALHLIEKNQPFFALIPGGLDQLGQLKAWRSRKGEVLESSLRQFVPTTQHRLRIHSPFQGETLSQRVLLEGETDSAIPVVFIEVRLDGSLLHRQEPSFPGQTRWRLNLPLTAGPGAHRLEMTLFFEDKTFARNEVGFHSIQVDEQLTIHQVPLRLVVSKGGTGFLTDLTANDFTIQENGSVAKIRYFSKEQSPLDIAIIFDTSISMTGEKLTLAKAALGAFFKELQPQDHVALWTFDYKVQRLSGFTNRFDELVPWVQTTTTGLATSLYDAAFVAASQLMDRPGTRILVILSDGSDSSSQLHDQHLFHTLKQSDMMVYSMILPGTYLGESNQSGNRLLRDIATATGSVSTTLRDMEDLESALKALVQEFRSFYYLTYESTLPPSTEYQVKRQLSIDTPGFRTRVRYRFLSVQ